METRFKHTDYEKIQIQLHETIRGEFFAAMRYHGNEYRYPEDDLIGPSVENPADPETVYCISYIAVGADNKVDILAVPEEDHDGKPILLDFDSISDSLLYYIIDDLLLDDDAPNVLASMTPDPDILYMLTAMVIPTALSLGFEMDEVHDEILSSARDFTLKHIEELSEEKWIDKEEVYHTASRLILQIIKRRYPNVE